MRRLTIFLNWAGGSTPQAKTIEAVASLARKHPGTMKTVLTRHYYLDMLSVDQLADIISAQRPTLANNLHRREKEKQKIAIRKFDEDMANLLKGKFSDPRHIAKLYQVLNKLNQAEPGTSQVTGILKNLKMNQAFLLPTRGVGVQALQAIPDVVIAMRNKALESIAFAAQGQPKIMWAVLKNPLYIKHLNVDQLASIIKAHRPKSAKGVSAIQKFDEVMIKELRNQFFPGYPDKLVKILNSLEEQNQPQAGALLRNLKGDLLNACNTKSQKEADKLLSINTSLELLSNKTFASDTNKFSLFVQKTLIKEEAQEAGLEKRKICDVEKLKKVSDKGLGNIILLNTSETQLILPAVIGVLKANLQPPPDIIQSPLAAFAMTNVNNFQRVVTYLNDDYKKENDNQDDRFMALHNLQPDEVAMICNQYMADSLESVRQFIQAYFPIYFFGEKSALIDMLGRKPYLATVLLVSEPIRAYIKTTYPQNLNLGYFSNIIDELNADLSKEQISQITRNFEQLINSLVEAAAQDELKNGIQERLLQQAILLEDNGHALVKPGLFNYMRDYLIARSLLIDENKKLQHSDELKCLLYYGGDAFLTALGAADKSHLLEIILSLNTEPERLLLDKFLEVLATLDPPITLVFFMTDQQTGAENTKKICNAKHLDRFCKDKLINKASPLQKRLIVDNKNKDDGYSMLWDKLAVGTQVNLLLEQEEPLEDFAKKSAEKANEVFTNNQAYNKLQSLEKLRILLHYGSNQEELVTLLNIIGEKSEDNSVWQWAMADKEVAILLVSPSADLLRKNLALSEAQIEILQKKYEESAKPDIPAVAKKEESKGKKIVSIVKSIILPEKTPQELPPTSSQQCANTWEAFEKLPAKEKVRQLLAYGDSDMRPNYQTFLSENIREIRGSLKEILLADAKLAREFFIKSRLLLGLEQDNSEPLLTHKDRLMIAVKHSKVMFDKARKGVEEILSAIIYPTGENNDDGYKPYLEQLEGDFKDILTNVVKKQFSEIAVSIAITHKTDEKFIERYYGYLENAGRSITTMLTKKKGSQYVAAAQRLLKESNNEALLYYFGVGIYKVAEKHWKVLGDDWYTKLHSIAAANPKIALGLINLGLSKAFIKDMQCSIFTINNPHTTKIFNHLQGSVFDIAIQYGQEFIKKHQARLISFARTNLSAAKILVTDKREALSPLRIAFFCEITKIHSDIAANMGSELITLAAAFDSNKHTKGYVKNAWPRLLELAATSPTAAEALIKNFSKKFFDFADESTQLRILNQLNEKSLKGFNLSSVKDQLVKKIATEELKSLRELIADENIEQIKQKVSNLSFIDAVSKESLLSVLSEVQNPEVGIAFTHYPSIDIASAVLIQFSLFAPQVVDILCRHHKQKEDGLLNLITHKALINPGTKKPWTFSELKDAAPEFTKNAILLSALAEEIRERKSPPPISPNPREEGAAVNNVIGVGVPPPPPPSGGPPPPPLPSLAKQPPAGGVNLVQVLGGLSDGINNLKKTDAPVSGEATVRGGGGMQEQAAQLAKARLTKRAEAKKAIAHTNNVPIDDVTEEQITAYTSKNEPPRKPPNSTSVLPQKNELHFSEIRNFKFNKRQGNEPLDKNDLNQNPEAQAAVNAVKAPTRFMRVEKPTITYNQVASISDGCIDIFATDFVNTYFPEDEDKVNRQSSVKDTLVTGLKTINDSVKSLYTNLGGEEKVLTELKRQVLSKLEELVTLNDLQLDAVKDRYSARYKKMPDPSQKGKSLTFLQYHTNNFVKLMNDYCRKQASQALDPEKVTTALIS